MNKCSYYLACTPVQLHTAQGLTKLGTNNFDESVISILSIFAITYRFLYNFKTKSSNKGSNFCNQVRLL